MSIRPHSSGHGCWLGLSQLTTSFQIRNSVASKGSASVPREDEVRV
jgi:hypothetical protein